MKLSRVIRLYRIFWLRRKWNRDKKERFYFSEIFKLAPLVKYSRYYWGSWMIGYYELKKSVRGLL